MTTFVEPADLGVAGTREFPNVDVAGVEWPLYKVQALIVALIVGVVALAATSSGQAAMWASATALIGVWWVQRVRTRASSTDQSV